MGGSQWKCAEAHRGRLALGLALSSLTGFAAASTAATELPRLGSIQRSCPDTGAYVTVLEGRTAPLSGGQVGALLLVGDGSSGATVDLGRPDLPSHVLVSERGLAVLVWATAEDIEARWFSASAEATGSNSIVESGQLEAGREPALGQGADGATTLILPLDREVLVEVNLASGAVDRRERAERRDSAASLEGLDAAVDADPTAPDAWAALTRALHREGEDERAREVLEEAVQTLHGGRTQPVSMRWSVTDPRARLTLNLYEERLTAGDAEGAHATLDDLERLYPCMEEAVLLRAELALGSAADESSGYAAADEVLRGTIHLLDGDEERAAAHVDAARFLEERGALEQAVQHLGEAVALGEDREIVLRTLARIEAARGNSLAAAVWLERLRARWENDLESLNDERRRASCAERIERITSEIESLR